MCSFFLLFRVATSGLLSLSTRIPQQWAKSLHCDFSRAAHASAAPSRLPPIVLQLYVRKLSTAKSFSSNGIDESGRMILALLPSPPPPFSRYSRETGGGHFGFLATRMASPHNSSRSHLRIVSQVSFSFEERNEIERKTQSRGRVKEVARSFADVKFKLRLKILF